MRSFIPVPDGDADVHAHYARDWLEAGGVRANFVCSVDGAISAGGLSRGLQTPGDNRVFAALRDLADVVLVGAGTATAEGYRPTSLSGRREELRLAHGLEAALPVAVVSGLLRIDPGAALYADPSTILLTTENADPSVIRSLAAEVVICGDEQVDFAAAIAALRSRGLTRVLCEGGPTLFASIAGAGLLDELCVSISPVLAGPGAGRLSAGVDWIAARDLVLTGLLEEDGALFGRYRMP
jgi:riboflavin biosynthesis pyrimidine reductase